MRWEGARESRVVQYVPDSTRLQRRCTNQKPHTGSSPRYIRGQLDVSYGQSPPAELIMNEQATHARGSADPFLLGPARTLTGLLVNWHRGE